MNEKPGASSEAIQLEIDDDDYQNLLWSKQLVSILPENSPLRAWHQKRIDVWEPIFKLRAELEKEESDGI